jgi:hypothetical protein
MPRAYAAEHEFHRAIESAVTARAGEQPYAIHPVVGLTQPTLQSARFVGDRLEMLRTYEGEELDGDGTVPRVSATPIEFDEYQYDRSVYASQRHASLQNALSVQTQLRGLLTPVEKSERFRDARGGLGLALDDLYSEGEEIPISVTAGVRRATLMATVVDLDTKRPVAGPLPLRTADDQLTHFVDLAPLPAGGYRLDVVSVGESAGTVQPVHGLFVVAGDNEPD